MKMPNLNQTKEKLIKKKHRKGSVQEDPSKLLAKFFSGVVIRLDEEYIYE